MLYHGATPWTASLDAGAHYFSPTPPTPPNPAVQEALALSRYHDGNPGEALAGVAQRLGICYYCWDRGEDLRQGICRDCRTADSIGIEAGEAEKSSPRDAAISYAFIREETVRELLEFLPEKFTSDLDTRALRQLPGNCIGQDRQVRETCVDSPWSVEYLPGRRRRWGTPVLMIELLSHPYPGVVQRLRHYAALLSAHLCGSQNVEEEPPFIVPVLLYNGLPAWTPRPLTKGWNRFEYTFIDVGRLRPDEVKSYRLVTALSDSKTAARRLHRHR